MASLLSAKKVAPRSVAWMFLLSRQSVPASEVDHEVDHTIATVAEDASSGAIIS